MKKQNKRIVLTRETLRDLYDNAGLEAAAAAALPISTVNTCRCPTLSCIHVGAC